MMALFATYAILVGTLLAVGAWAVEGLCRLFGLSSRRAWVVGLLGALLIPEVALIFPDFALAPAIIIGPRAAGMHVATGQFYDGVVGMASRWDMVIAVGWIALSLAAVGCAGATLFRAHRARSTWRRARIAGHEVLVSERVGPGVVGIFRTEIVVPEWVLGLPRAQQQLILAHEREHIEASDPRLFGVALLALCVAPWHPAVWWMVRRLRLATEIDCDARVLRSGSDLATYGGLLLDVGKRMTRSPQPMTAMAGPASNLERRIRAMTSSPRGADRLIRTGALGLLAAGAMGSAWLAPTPIIEYCDVQIASATGRIAPEDVLTMRATAPKVVKVLGAG